MNEMPNLPKKIVEMISKTQEAELSCDEVHALIGQYTEMAVAGENVAELLPMIYHHLEMCPDCREEFEALSRILCAQVE